MIENQLAAMPSSHARHDAGEQRHKNSMRQHVAGASDPQTPVEAGAGDQRHRGDRMCPAGDAAANARHRQKLDRADSTGCETEEEDATGTPEAGPQPERIGGPPEQRIDRKRYEGKGDREVHAHRMQRVPGDGNCRAGILVPDIGHDRARRFGIVFHYVPPFAGQIHQVRTWFRVLALACVSAALSSCTGDLSALDPAGPSAGSIAQLWWVMLWGSVVLFTLVVGLFAATLFRPRFGRGLSQSGWIVWGGLVLPLPVLTALTFYAFSQGEILLSGGSAKTEDVLEVRAVGSMWQWQFSYPSLPGSRTATGLLHIPAGRTIEIIAESEDVIHSFWVPRLGGKIDAVPGHANRLRIRADHPGRYGGVCSEYCGTGHAGMRFEVRAHTADDFEKAIIGELAR